MSTSSDLEVRDEDRLPWLETVDEEYERGPSALRIILLVVLALVIAAQEGDYKVKPDDPGGLKVEGEGDSAIATSEGAGAGNASIDLKALPEAPVAGTKAAPGTTVTGGSSTTVATIPASGGKLKAAAGVIAQSPADSSGSSLVQLGSFPDEATANSAWARASKRFTYLAPLGKSVQKAEVNGASVYRLRVNAGSAGQASELCGKLKVAGEDCFIPRN
jgi:SPOR domain